MVKEVVWWTRLKGLKTDTLLFLFKVHLKKKVRTGGDVLPSNFVERWVNVAKMARVNWSTLNIRL